MSPESDALDTSIEGHLRGLSRALVQDRHADVQARHRELYLIGEAVIPRVSEQLLAYSWKKVKFDEQLILLSGLLSLAHDIDEDAARDISERIEAKGCSPSVRSIMRAILSFSMDNFYSFSVDGIPVYSSKELSESYRTIERKMKRWLIAVPEEDRGRIDRIYVVPSCGTDTRGTYTPILCKIAVLWDVPSNPFLRWFGLLKVEFTLYHEIGHHVHRHEGLGQDLDQEDEANDYARRLSRKRHPVLRAVMPAIAKLLGRQKDVDREESS